MNNEIIEVSELDCIYLTYDEALADEFWAQIQANIPWAKRVHGVEGSDAAHKAAGNASDTERFILIDGDNLPNWEFFNQQLRINSVNKDSVFRWRAYNEINGLCYGNGGISSWTKEFVANMRTHEATEGSDETVVEFCFDNKYWAMHDVWSTTYPNQSARQAWRAGFREGVKLCLDQGRRPTLEEFDSAVWKGNRDNLVVWCNLGRDVEWGEYAILGARQGAYMTMFDDAWDYAEVRDFKQLNIIYQETVKESEIDKMSRHYASTIKQRLGLEVEEFDADQSSWVKKYNRPYQNIDIMLPERDFQRVINETAKQLWR